MRQRLALLIGLVMALVPLTTAHVYNFEDKHEACGVYGAPQSHFVGDGHPHTHDPVAAAPLHDHDPCKQNRMDYPDYENNKPLSPASPPVTPLDPDQILYDDNDPSNTEAFVGGEYYQFPLPRERFIEDPDGIAVTSDLVAAGMGFPGSGTPADPYIVEGYVINGGNMLFKDTSKCFVIRNNIIVNDPKVVLGPVLPDPLNIVHLPDLSPTWEQVKRDAEALRQQYLNLSDDWEALWDQWQADKAVKDAEKAVWDQQRAEYEADLAAWQAAFEAYEDEYVGAVRYLESLVDEYQGWADDHRIALDPQPVRTHAQYIDASGEVTDMDALVQAFEAYMPAVRQWFDDNPPPQTPPPGWLSGQAAWDAERQNHDSYVAAVDQFIDVDYPALLTRAPDEAAYQAFLADYNAFLADYDAWMATVYDVFLADYDAFLADYAAFQDEFDAVWASTGQDIADADAFFAKVALWDYEYVGQLGSTVFNTQNELVEWVLQAAYGVVDALIEIVDNLTIPNPNLVVQNNGQLILDWNGQCIHAYNNVVNDLRVNQNNDRTGYATGGVIEDNRIFVVGQIRHYDGIFRENEVGNKAHLVNLVDAGVTASPATPAQAVNNDGANQGWYYDNVIYGNVDLDFHGHHHAAGFFAPTSHYHGSTRTVAYMQGGSGCTANHGTPDETRGSGPWYDYPTDNDIHVLGDPLVEQADPVECLPHQDHGKRWTSVFFNDNVVIDPNGVGIRFEDRNHRADDEQANSENMKELKRPHFHQKWVQMEDNVVVGKMFIDVLNAAGTHLWTDDWSAAQSPAGAGRTVEALDHPGAEVVNSHPYRNDAWLDIQRNHVFLTQATGILVSDADDLSLFQLKDNRGYGFPRNHDTDMSPQQLLDWFRAAPAKPVDQVWTEMQAWNGQDRGVQTLASMSFLRDAFRVEHCGQAVRGLDRGIVATDRIYDDGQSVVASCGTSDWGGAAGVALAYTPAPQPAPECTENVREETADTDDFYASELLFDVVDTTQQATLCDNL